MYKVRKEIYGVVHRIAFCDECDWNESWYKDAHIKAREHTKQTGHTTHVESGMHWDYKTLDKM